MSPDCIHSYMMSRQIGGTKKRPQPANPRPHTDGMHFVGGFPSTRTKIGVLSKAEGRCWLFYGRRVSENQPLTEKWGCSWEHSRSPGPCEVVLWPDWSSRYFTYLPRPYGHSVIVEVGHLSIALWPSCCRHDAHSMRVVSEHSLTSQHVT